MKEGYNGIKTINGLAHYGLLSHENEIVFTVNTAKSDICDEITIEIPDDWEVSYYESGDTLLTSPKELGGETYLPKEILITINDNPYLRVVTRNNGMWTSKKLFWKKV